MTLKKKKKNLKTRVMRLISNNNLLLGIYCENIMNIILLFYFGPLDFKIFISTIYVLLI